jgi:hypothetical protein
MLPFVMCYVHRVFYCAIFVACRQYVLGVDRTGAIVFMEFVWSLNFTANILFVIRIDWGSVSTLSDMCLLEFVCFVLSVIVAVCLLLLLLLFFCLEEYA